MLLLTLVTLEMKTITSDFRIDLLRSMNVTLSTQLF